MSVRLREPLNAVMLGIDPGERSGWAVVYGGRLVVFGTAKDRPEDRDLAVSSAQAVAEGGGVPLMVGIEKFGAGLGAGRFFGARTLAGIERRVGAWVDAVERAGVKRSRIVRVLPQTWRWHVLGKGRGSHEEMAAVTSSYVQRRFDLVTVPGEDECAAIGIACWMARAEEVQERMPKRRGAR